MNQKAMLSACLLVFFCLLTELAHAKTVAHLNARFSAMPVSTLAEYYLDESNNLMLADLRSMRRQDWFQTQSSAPFFGYSRDTLWVRLPIHNAGSTSLNTLLEVQYPLLDRVDVFVLERGDLVKTINHNDGSGDEEWREITDHRQTVVSGVYIAHFELPDGRSTFRKFLIIR